jgi:hypothetical protein
VSSEKTVDAWITRAKKRTVKHFEQEVQEVQRLERLGAPRDLGPLPDAALECSFEMERMVLRGQLLAHADADETEAENADTDRSDVGAGDRDEPESTACPGPVGGAARGDIEGIGADGCDDEPPQARGPQMSGVAFGLAALARGTGSLGPQMFGAALGPGASGPSDGSPGPQMSGVVSGAGAGDGSLGPQMSATEPSDEADPRMSVLMDADERAFVLATRKRPLKLRLSYRNYLRWAALEEIYAGVARRTRTDKSFIEFMLEAVWEVWGPQFRRTRAWEHIYVRDRCRCTNPTCRLRTLTAHHLKFRSHGGGHEPENVTTLCPDCHLFGVHEGWITVSPPASNMRWVLGRNPTLIIEGRDKIDPHPVAPWQPEEAGSSQAA